MTFDVPAESYDRHIGRYSRSLAVALADVAGVAAGQTALDVGSGTGALATVLVERLGPGSVAAIDPSGSFAAALRDRLPGVDVRQGPAESLPFETGRFDAALAQLVVNFMTDPDQGVGEMRRVVRTGGRVAAAVWDYGDGMTLLREFFAAAMALFPDRAAAVDERTTMTFARDGELGTLFARVGLEAVETGAIVVEAAYRDFDDLWAPLPAGPGPSGAFVASLGPADQAALARELRQRLGAADGPFSLNARAWYAVGTV